MERPDNRKQLYCKDALIQKNRTQLPSSSVARRVNELPKLNPAIEEVLSRQSRRSTSSSPTNTGVVLPPHNLNTLSGYYLGEWNKGQPEGFGKLYYQNGSYYEGPFVAGALSGRDGLYVYPDGSYKQG